MCRAATGQYGGSAAQCGELVITAANGKQSVDTVTITIGGKAANAVHLKYDPEQIDNAMPRDLIMVPPALITNCYSCGSRSACKVWEQPPPSSTQTHILPESWIPGGRSSRACSDWRPTANRTPPRIPSTPRGTYQCGGWTGFNGVLE